jgi:hypothetical protein
MASAWFSKGSPWLTLPLGFLHGLAETKELAEAVIKESAQRVTEEMLRPVGAGGFCRSTRLSASVRASLFIGNAGNTSAAQAHPSP